MDGGLDLRLGPRGLMRELVTPEQAEQWGVGGEA